MTHPSARWPVYAGLFVISLATLMFEILLTRIFSVTMWYHFAFFAVSVAMFGMTFGAVIVYLAPGRFVARGAAHDLALYAWLFSVTIVAAFLAHLVVPTLLPGALALRNDAPVILTFIVIAVPFVFSGIAVSLALTRFPRQVGGLYGADLAGAAAGCILLVVTIDATDGPSTVLIVAALAALAALLFALEARDRALIAAAGVTVVTMGAMGVGNAWAGRQGQPPLHVTWVKGRVEGRPAYERWNSFARIAVFGDTANLEPPFGWGLSPTFPPDRRIHQLGLNIDAEAATVMTGYHGDPVDLEHFKYDVTNLAHYLRPDARVLAIGVGGGRDVLSALAFGQRAVTGVEINQQILYALNERFGDFTGHLDRDPRVRFVNDEARSFIARTPERFDIIQASLIDTWAATASGAFVFTENGLYTIEAWDLFLQRLTPDGLLTFSRWYYRERPAEIYRMTGLAAVALARAGVADPTRHIALVRRMHGEKMDAPAGIGTIVVSRRPLSDVQIRTVRDVAARMRFEVMLVPGEPAVDPMLRLIASGKSLNSLFARYPLDITPPTDDKPFFFHMLRLRDRLTGNRWDVGVGTFNIRAVYLLGTLSGVVVVLTVLCIIGPLAFRSDVAALKSSWPLLVFFAAIGLGFMFIEISQMQRLIIFLGHPVYGLSVLLFSLLLSSGVGSLLSPRTAETYGSWRLIALLGVLLVFGILSPAVTHNWSGATTPVRIALSVGMLLPLGLFMGSAFPLGMRVAAARAPGLTAWLWGVNGALSVCASVFAVVISLTNGIAATFWTGFACYVVAAGAFVVAAKRKNAITSPASAMV